MNLPQKALRYANRSSVCEYLGTGKGHPPSLNISEWPHWPLPGPLSGFTENFCSDDIVIHVLHPGSASGLSLSLGTWETKSEAGNLTYL